MYNTCLITNNPHIYYFHQNSNTNTEDNEKLVGKNTLNCSIKK